MKNSSRSVCQFAVWLGFLLGGASACGSSDSGISSGSSAGSSGTSSSAQAGSSSVGGQGQTNSGGSANGGSAPTAAAGTSAGGSTGASGSSSGGSSTSGGSPGQAGSAAQAGSAGSVASAGAAGGGATTTAHFSFFVTSLEAIRRESKNQNGYGGNLGGLAGADAICTRIAEASLAGSGAKGWKAFLSTSKENAIERIGTGPWYDRNDKLVASDTAGLLQERPNGMTTINDLPNELGIPNRAGTGTGMDDNHDTITGSNTQGKWDGGATCSDWTSASGSDGPRVGHSWPANSGKNWIQAHTAPGCEPSVALVQTGGGSGDGIGNGGGYGGFYCFALKP
ncbi:MAG TPA: hypothetical protein VER96_06300 [Polyangiaceae bacterium]|nr:hypothetical protein [Polyangiaceae bacterium]